MFCYSVIKVLCFLSKTLNYIITSRSFCQELFQKSFHLLFRRFRSLWCELLYIITHFLICQEVFQLSFKMFYIFLLKNVFLMCNGYYIIITVYLRQAFFNIFLFIQKNTRYCTFSVFLSFTPHMRLIELLFFYQFFQLSNSVFLINSNLLQVKVAK